MGLGVGIHYIGTFCLLAATVLLIIPTISAPVINKLALFEADFHRDTPAGYGTASFGAWGYCLRGNGEYCTGSHVGYSPSTAASAAGVPIKKAYADTMEGLSNVFVLHPVGAAVCFVAMFASIAKGPVGSLIASLISFVGFVVAIVCVACDFACFKLLKHELEKHISVGKNADETWGNGRWAAGIWCTVAAACFALIATILIFVTCCAGRRKQRHQNRKLENMHSSPPAHRRRRFFWQRRTRY